MEISAEDRKIVDAGILAVQSQAKQAEAQLIAAKAFERLVALLEKLEAPITYALSRYGHRLVILLLLVTVAVSAQEPKHATKMKVSKDKVCSTHSRQIMKPWTWFDSNMCDADYQRWLDMRGPVKPFYKSTRWWIGETMIAGAMFADTWTTWHRPAGGVEENPILGTNPDPGMVGAVSAVGFGIQTGLHIWAYNLAKDSPSKTWAFIGHWEVPVIVGVVAGNNAYNNFNVGYSPKVNPGKPALKDNPMYQIKH